jgi:uroporphyrinogen-III synthase
MRVVVTASRGRLEGVETALGALGHDAVRRPLTETETILNPVATASLKDLGWWLFPSRTAVAAALANALHPGAARIAAVGPGTARDLESAGFRVAVVASPATAEGLAAAVLAHPFGPTAGDVVGAVQGDRARGALRCALSGRRVGLISAVLYRSRTLRWEPSGEVDVVVLASPSATRALPAEVLSTAHLIAIGPTTAAALRSRGLDPLEAAAPSVAGVLEAVRRLAQRREP